MSDSWGSLYVAAFFTEQQKSTLRLRSQIHWVSLYVAAFFTEQQKSTLEGKKQKSDS